MARTVTKTRIADLTREIRREAKYVDNLVYPVSVRAKQDGCTFNEVLDRPDWQHHGACLAEALNVIDGNTALLRELLEVEG